MKKIFIFFTVISFALVGCSQEPKSQIIKQATEKDLKTNSDTKMHVLELKVTEEIDIFKRALSNSQKEPGIINMANPQYQFNVDEESFFLWITKESGTIMNTEDTHTIYSLSNSSVKEVFEFVQKGQSHNFEEVVNNHNDIQNFDGLDRFVKNVRNQNEAKINYIQYGTEGQRGARTLTFDGEQINVSHSVDGNFVEEYNCKKIIVETEDEIKNYILSECTGSFNGDFELLSIPNNFN